MYMGIILLIIIEVVLALILAFKDDNKRSCPYGLLLILLNILLAVDLGVNFVIALTGYSDGIAIHGFLSKLVIYEEVWTIQLFKNYYQFQLVYTLLSIAVYFLYCIKLKDVIQKLKHK